MQYDDVIENEVYLFIGTEFSPRGVVKIIRKSEHKISASYLDSAKKFGANKDTNKPTSFIHPKWLKKPT